VRGYAGLEHRLVSVSQPKKSDLGVRTASALAMLAVTAAALWSGLLIWQAFVLLVGVVCYGELARLIFKAFPTALARACMLVPGFLYVGYAVYVLSALPLGVLYHGPVPHGGRLIGLGFLLAVVGLVVCTDVGAYFAGRTIGGPKIAPSVSPSKTWAGLAGGMLAAGLWGLLALPLPHWLVGDYGVPQLARYGPAAFASGAILAVFAQAGDFGESWLKRKAGVKDSSNLIPGHGGVLDRIDGLLPVVWVYGIAGDWLIFRDWLAN
jgi:phosphatidate cytidylyltransferase